MRYTAGDFLSPVRIFFKLPRLCSARPRPRTSTRRSATSATPRRRGATPNHRHARRCASPKNIILDFLAPNSSFGDYNNMGGKVLVYKKSVMEVALEWVRAAVRRADECVKAL